MSFSPWFSFPLCCCLSLTLCLVSALKRTRVSHSCRVYIDPCVFELFTLITTNVEREREREDGEKNPLLQMKAIILLISFRGSTRNHIQQTLVYHSAGFHRGIFTSMFSETQITKSTLQPNLCFGISVQRHRNKIELLKREDNHRKLVNICTEVHWSSSPYSKSHDYCP